MPSDLKDAIFQGLTGGVSNLPQFIKKLIRLSDIANIADIANFFFKELVKFYGLDSNCGDFISRSVSAMKLLQGLTKGNLLDKFADCLT